MALLYMSRRKDGPLWRECLAPLIPDLDFRIHPHIGDAEAIDAVLVWNFPLDDLAHLPGLRLVMSLGAGVDHVVGASHLVPEGVILTRIVDPAMTSQMTEWCLNGDAQPSAQVGRIPRASPGTPIRGTRRAAAS